MEKFKEILRKYGIEEDKISMMAEYAVFLLEENEKYNLTRIIEPEDMALRHFIDSISACGFIPKGAKVIDVGTGGGFPGIPIKIMRPDIDLVLADSSHKKIDFVRAGASRLGLPVSAVAKRAEEMKEWRGTFDIVVSRAVAALNILCELCVPLLKTGGTLLAYKGADAGEEIERARHALIVLNCSLSVHDAGMQGREHKILEIKKQEPTPEQYPRRFSRIKKSPL